MLTVILGDRVMCMVASVGGDIGNKWGIPWSYTVIGKGGRLDDGFLLWMSCVRRRIRINPFDNEARTLREGGLGEG
jgi:hypothetical protein